MKGKLTITLDCEYGWGHLAKNTFNDLTDSFSKTSLINRRLLAVFEEFDIPVTWAVVGAIDIKSSERKMLYNYLRSCGLCEAAILRLIDSNKGNSSDSIFFDPHIIDDIKGSPVSHDIGSHTFSHHFLDEISEKHVLSDCKLMSALNHERGLDYVSLVFPKNIKGFLEVYEQFGYKIVRGEDKTRKWRVNKITKKLMRALEWFFVLSPLTVNVYRQKNILVLPGSLLFRIKPNNIFYRINAMLLTARIKKGLKMAIKKGETLHLWWHPFNFAYKEQLHFKILEKILIEVDKLIKEEKLEVYTLRDHYVKSGKIL